MGGGKKLTRKEHRGTVGDDKIFSIDCGSDDMTIYMFFKTHRIVHLKRVKIESFSHSVASDSLRTHGL